MVEYPHILPPIHRGNMTTTTIIQIALAILLIWLIKLYFLKIDKKIDADIEKEKEKEKQKKADKNYRLNLRKKELEKTIEQIERIAPYETTDLRLIKRLSYFLRDDQYKMGYEYGLFTNLLTSHYFDNPRLKARKESLELEYKKKCDDLQQKQQELELREARIVKIESAQKILNSELVEKINKQFD